MACSKSITATEMLRIRDGAALQQRNAFGQGIGAFGQSLGGGFSDLAAAQQQQNSLYNQMVDAAMFGRGTVKVEHIPVKKMGDVYMGVRTFREELQHDVDQWLKGVL